MSYSPMSFTTATAGRAGFVRLGTGIGGQSDGTIVSTITASSLGLGNVTNESKTTMFTNPTFTGTVGGVTATHVGLGNVTNESKATMFSSPTFTGSATFSQAGFSGAIGATSINFGGGALSTFVPMTSWTPTVTGGGGGGGGFGPTSVVYSKYSRIGDIVFFEIRFQDIGGVTIGFSLPVATSTYGANGSWSYRSSAGNISANGSWIQESSGIFTGTLTSNSAGAGEYFYLSGQYHVA